MTGTVLIIDDNVELAENLQEILLEENVPAETAASGAEGLERIAQGGISVVVTDMRMPGMNGLEVIRFIKERWPTLPVVVVTAYARDELLDAAQAEGAVGVISKPLDMARFTRMVRGVVEDGAHVLIVEDDADLRGSLCEILAETPGLVPVPRATGESAERALETGTIDAAIVDLRLPDCDGIALGQRIRRANPKVTVIYITGYADDFKTSLEEVLRSDGVHLMEKPFAPEDLLEVVRGASS